MPETRLILGDCLQELPKLSGSYVVVTDPPFGVREDEWDRMDEWEFARFSMAWLSMVRPIAKEMIVFGTGYGFFRSLCDLLWERVRVILWNKPKGSQYAGSAERGLWFAHEIILHCYIKPPGIVAIGEQICNARKRAGLTRPAVDIAIRGKKTGLCYRWEEASSLPSVEDGERLAKLLSINGDFMDVLRRHADECRTADATDVFTHRTETNGIHPCEKPLGLMLQLIERLTESGDVILDPFMGSGTTLAACVQLGRNCIGIERDENYFAIAQRRIAAERAKGNLFADCK